MSGSSAYLKASGYHRTVVHHREVQKFMTELPHITEPVAPPPTVHVLEDIPPRALIVCAHPDDAEIGPGATIARWSAQGCEVVVVVSTTGSGGSNDRGMSRERLIELRSKEQEDSAHILGVKKLEMLGYPDGGLEDTYEFRSQIVWAIRQYKPHTILTHDPYRMKNFQHRDHRITGFVTMDAMYPFARDHLHFPEHLKDGRLEPHKAVRLLMWGADVPDVIVDVTDTLETKIEALSRHVSQVQGLAPGGQVGERLRERARQAAVGFPFSYGEVFRQLLARG